MIAAFGGPTVRCVGYASYGTAELSRLVVEGLKDRDGVLLANHGAIVTGATCAGRCGAPWSSKRWRRSTISARSRARPSCCPMMRSCARSSASRTYGPRERSTRLQGLPARSGNNPFSPASVAAQTPRSVMRPVTKRAGVTSKAKLRAGRAVGRELNSIGAPSAPRPLIWVTSRAAALFDRDVTHAVGDAPVDGRRRQGDIERHAIVMRRERLEIGADLVAHVAGARRAVAADDDEIDQPVLHEMAAGVVGDDRMRNLFAQQFEGREARALVARTRLVDPDMDRRACRAAL